ncbi:MAG: MFS transporter [Acidimicrobiales bacterium]
MSLYSGATAYGRLLCLPTARRAVVASSVCRLSYGTLVLANLLVVEQATRSFAVAGAATAVFSLCTLSAPAKARFMGDQHRRGRVASLSAAYIVSLLGLGLLASRETHEAAPFVALSATAGLSVPPVGAMMRARWASITAPADRQRAYALDVALEDGLFLAGPLLTGALVALDGPGLAMWVTAALFSAGIGLLLLAPQPRPAGPALLQRGDADRRADGVLGPLRSGSVRAVLVVLLGVSAGAGVIDVAVAARAVDHAEPAAAGYVLAAGALGSVTGGLIWGHVSHRVGAGWQLAGLAGLVAATLAASAVAPNLPALAAVLVVNGAALSPLLVVVYVVVDALATTNYTLVSTWANTTFNAGVAAGAAGGGILVASYGPASALLIGAAIAATAAAVAIVVRRLITTDRSPAGPTERTTADNR